MIGILNWANKMSTVKKSGPIQQFACKQVGIKAVSGAGNSRDFPVYCGTHVFGAEKVKGLRATQHAVCLGSHVVESTERRVCSKCADSDAGRFHGTYWQHLNLSSHRQ